MTNEHESQPSLQAEPQHIGLGNSYDPNKARYQKRTVIHWADPVSRKYMEGVIQDIAWVEDSIPKWAVDYFPRFLWWLFWKRERCWAYETRGTDGKLYSIHEADIIDNGDRQRTA